MRTIPFSEYETVVNLGSFRIVGRMRWPTLEQVNNLAQHCDARDGDLLRIARMYLDGTLYDRKT